MKEDESDLQLLKAQIRRLKLDLEKKNHEINVYIEKIHDNEEEIMELQELISKTTSEQDFQKIIDSKMKFEIKEKEREIRDLKNRMGFLRQEKTIAQKELEEFKIISKSTAISVEQIRKEEKLNQDLLNLETLTNELRRKLYIQEILNDKLKVEIGEKEREINNLNLLMSELRQGLKVQNSILEGKFFKEKIKKELDKKLQKELNESKKQIETLKNQLAKFKEPERNKIKHEIEISGLKNEIIYLKEELDRKDRILKRLKSKN
jgi:chromosome segregation ATPase